MTTLTETTIVYRPSPAQEAAFDALALTALLGARKCAALTRCQMGYATIGSRCPGEREKACKITTSTKAADGIRTHDLLHGKQMALIRHFYRKCLEYGAFGKGSGPLARVRHSARSALIRRGSVPQLSPGRTRGLVGARRRRR